MNYPVEWTEDARISIALIWVQSDDPPAVHRLRDDINLRLAKSPKSGTETREGFWILEHATLRLLYELDDPQRLVTVVSVKQIKLP